MGPNPASFIAVCGAAPAISSRLAEACICEAAGDSIRITFAAQRRVRHFRAVGYADPRRMTGERPAA